MFFYLVKGSSADICRADVTTSTLTFTILCLSPLRTVPFYTLPEIKELIVHGPGRENSISLEQFVIF